jgi:hypothetical protein
MQISLPRVAVWRGRDLGDLQSKPARVQRFVGVAAVALAAGLAAPWGSVAADRPNGGVVVVAQAGAAGSPTVLIAAQLLVEPGKQAPLPIQVESTDPTLLASLLLVVKGLPPTISLSKGYAVTAGTWIVPVLEKSNLAINVPMEVKGRSEVLVSLMGRDGKLVAEARTTLIVAPPVPAAATTQSLAPASPALTAATSPSLSPADRQSAENMVGLGERELEQGNIARARLFFLRAAQMGLARGASLLATTYDPNELARLRAVGVQADLAEARKWYDRARELGAPETTERLSRLPGR